MSVENIRKTDRRREQERRWERNRQSSVYLTRRDWMIAEIVIGVVSCATAITGIAGGLVAEALRSTQSNGFWFFSFYGTGGGLILIAALEMNCRRRECSDRMLRVFARTRMYLHFGNALCWLTAFLWMVETKTFAASIVYQALPLLVINFCGAVEHAKAIFLDKARAGNTSLVGALFQRLSRG